MALLLTSNTPSLTSLPSSSSSKSSTPRVSILSISANSLFRIHKQTITLGPKLFNGLQVHKSFILKQRGSVIVKASSDVDGTSPDGAEPPTESEDEEEAVPVENLPLESKLQLKLEQKMRMKLAKKIRLRRKRLLRKRRWRKKGRWPPSKLKKNKNV